MRAPRFWLLLPLLVSLVSPARGDFLPGDTRVPPTTDSPLEGFYTLQTSLTADFLGTDAAGNPRFQGTLSTRVFRSDLDGTLVFEYQLRNVGPENILSLALADFGGQPLLGVLNRLIDAPEGYVAGQASYAADGSTVTFFDYRFRDAFGQEGPVTGVPAGEPAARQDVFSAAPGWTLGTAELRSRGGMVLGVPVLVPVPEPTTLALFGLGGMALVGWGAARARRRVTIGAPPDPEGPGGAA